MTYQRYFEKRLGKAAVKRLPSAWKRHITRIDAIPKPSKLISARKLLTIVGV